MKLLYVHFSFVYTTFYVTQGGAERSEKNHNVNKAFHFKTRSPNEVMATPTSDFESSSYIIIFAIECRYNSSLV